MNKKRALKVLEMFLDKQCSIKRTLNHMDTTDVEIWDAVYTATKALSAEPCEDAISRAEAEALFRNARSKLNPSDYKTADEFNTRDLMLLNAEQFIHLLPSVTPKQKMGRWIPVSERLPEVKYDSLGNNISDYVLLLVKKGDYETYKVGYFSPPNCFDAITSDGWFISVCALKDVIAWMPLPEPYNAESEDA